MAPAAAFVIGLLVGVVPLLRGRTFFHWDNAQQHLAQTTFLHDALRRGIWPEWWPHVGLGFPTVAEGQSAHLYPIRVLLAAAFDPSTALALEVGTYLGLAALTSYFFLRELRADRWSALFGALVHVLGGFSLPFVRNVALHRSLWLLPLFLLLAERCSRRVTPGSLAGLAVVFGLQLLSGHPTFAIVSGVSATLYLCVRVAQRSWSAQESLPRATRKLTLTLVTWTAALVLGLGVGAAQLVPTLLHVPHSIRQGGLDFDYATRGLTSGVLWMGQLVLPYAYELGDLRQTPTVFGTYFNQNPARGFYLGALAPLLILIALARARRNPHVPTLLICAALTFGFSLGGDAPLFPALRAVPGLEGLRYPQRFLGSVSLLLAAVAALGAQSLTEALRARVGQPLGKLLAFYLGTAVILGAAFFACRTQLEAVGVPATDLWQGLAVSLALAFGAAGLVYLFAAGRLQERAWMASLIVLTMVDLLGYRAAGDYAQTVPIAEATQPSESAAFLQAQQGDFRVLSLQSADGGTFPADVLRDLLVADLPSIWGLKTSDAYGSLMLGRHFVLHESLVWQLNARPESAPRLLSFLGAMNVRFVVGRPDAELPGMDLVFAGARTRIWENPEWLPPAYLVYGARREVVERRFEWDATASLLRLPDVRAMLADWELRASDAVILDNVMAGDIDFSVTAVVAGPFDAALGRSPPGTGHVEAAEELDPDRRVFRVETSRPALLVWSESYYPGWRATLDGEPIPTLRANFLMTAVRVPAGSHLVAFTYRTPGLRAGLIITVLTTLLLCLGLVGARRYRRHAAANP